MINRTAAATADTEAGANRRHGAGIGTLGTTRGPCELGADQRKERRKAAKRIEDRWFPESEDRRVGSQARSEIRSAALILVIPKSDDSDGILTVKSSLDTSLQGPSVSRS